MTKRITLALSFVALFAQSWGQSNPAAQTLPYSQNFSTFTGATTTYPAGVQGWTVTGSLAATYPTAAPANNQALVGGTNSAGSAGVYDMNGKIGLFSTASSMRAICLALNTTGSSNISLAFDAATQGQISGGRINEIGLQYRLGTSGTFTNIASSTYSNNAASTTTASGTTASNISTISLTLPSACDNQAVVQLRWIIREISGSGNRPSFSIDNISVTASSPTVAITAQDPNTPTAVNWPIGGALNQFYWASVTASGGNAVLNSVTANMSGTYMAADITAAGLKLYYSSDATMVPAGDVLLGSQSSIKSGATENITWSSLTQTITSGSTGYIYATADVSSGATAGRTLAGSFTSNANVVFTPTVSYGVTSYGATTDKTFLNLPTNPTIFAINCSSEAKINIDMNAPTTGTVVVFANTTGSFTDPVGAGTSFTGANSNYSSAPNYPAVGGNLIYNGPGNNIAIQGLTAGLNYSFKAYSYNGSTWSSGTAVITASTVTQPVSSVLVSPSSGQLQLTWNNPAATVCYNNVIIIARQASAVEPVISKGTFDGLLSSADFTGANSVWTSNGNANDVYDLTSSLIGTNNTNFLVYKGTGTSAMITGLTNGVAYHFRIFTVDGLGALARWSAGIDASGIPDLPGYHWNGGNIATTPAAGGSGTWGTTNAWRQPSASGTQATWANNNTAVFAGTAGAVTLDANRIATSYLFNTSSYTVQTTSGAGLGLTGPIILANNNELVLAPNAGSTANGVLAVESVTGTGTASVTIFGNQGASASARINLAALNGSVNVPTNIVSATGTGVAGYVATATGASVNGNITNNSSLTTCIGATSGNDITVNSIISGTSGLQFSAGASGGAGIVTLNNNNTYSGPTRFNSTVTGTVVMGVNNALPSSSDMIMSFSSGNGGNLDLNGTSQSIGNLSSNVSNTSVITNNSAVSNSTLTVNQTMPQAFDLVIRDGATRQVALVKNGPAMLTLTRSGSTFSGGLTINNGELRLSPTIATLNLSTCPVVLNGGTLGTSGVVAGTDLNFSTLKVTDNSTISLSPSNTHTVVFAASNGLIWTSSKTLVITGWQGTYTTTTGSSGTTGQIFVGTSASDLTATQLSQIKFYDGMSYYGAKLLSTGEVVPYNDILTKMQPTFCGYTADSFGEFLRADSVLGAHHYRFQLVNTATSYTQTFTNSSGYPYLTLYNQAGISYNTTYTVTVGWSADGTNWSNYGPACTITSPLHEVTELQPAYCGFTASTYSQIIYANRVSGATQYEYKLVNAALSYTQTFVKTNNNFNLTQFTGLQDGTTYSVSLRVFIFGAWDIYGSSCNVTTPSSVTTTSLQPSSCGITVSSYPQILYAVAVSGATQYEYRLTNAALSYTQTFLKTNNNFNLGQFTGLAANTAYSVAVRANVSGVWGNFGTVCTVTTPSGILTTSLQPAYCGIVASSYAQVLYAVALNGATQYEYRLENAAMSYTQTYVKTNNNFNLTQFTGLNNGTTYSVSVRAFIGGSFGSYGPVCTISTPASSPTTSLQPASCGITLSAYTQILFATAVTGATQYEYRLENAGLGYSQSFAKSNNNFNFGQFTGLVMSTTYAVQVRVFFNGAWGAYGPVCNITTPAFPAMMIGSGTNGMASREGVENAETNGISGNNFEAIAYPNPFNNEFAISLVSYQVNETVTIRVFDATGKLMEQHSVLPNAVKDMAIGSGYAQGLYNIVVSQGSQSKSIKVIRS